MSSASRKASRIVVRRSTICSSFSFGTVIRVSTSLRSRSIPSSACAMRFLPSNSKGLVTAPTVRAPISCLAISAITGAAPVPVPPPSPQVMKIMSAPFSESLISSRDSAAAPAPTSGLAPAPRPLVRLWPMPILTSASQAWRACASVLTATNSTPRRPASTMRLTAFEPPPPTPTTLITARYDVSIVGPAPSPSPPIRLRGTTDLRTGYAVSCLAQACSLKSPLRVPAG